MKKYTISILISIIILSSVGFFITKFTANAQDQTGTCIINGQAQSGMWTQSACQASNGNWSVYQLLVPLPCPPGSTGCTTDAKGNQVLSSFDVNTTNSLGSYLNIMIKIVIGIAAVMAVVMIVIGGIEYMTSELISNKEDGKERITHAIFGLLIALGSWALLNTINPDLLNDSLNSLTTAEVTINIGGESTAPFAAINRSSLLYTGVSCNGGGGTLDIPNIAQSFIGRASYSQTARNTVSGSTINVDCSSFVDQVYSCAGLTPPGNNTTAIFSSIGSTKITSTDIGTSSAQITVNGSPLKVGDLLGWKPSDDPNGNGHVVMYIGNGQIIDAQNTSNAVTARPLSAAMQSRLTYFKPAP